MDTNYPTSLCHRCQYVRYVDGKNTRFCMCTAEAVPAKYPPQPVSRCGAFKETKSA